MFLAQPPLARETLVLIITILSQGTPVSQLLPWNENVKNKLDVKNDRHIAMSKTIA